MFYLPSNPPHSANESIAYSSEARIGTKPYDYAVTKKVFGLSGGRDEPGDGGLDGGRRVYYEMIKWWSEHYGDKLAGWWFDGMYRGNVQNGHNNMSQEYNIATMANYAKAGNPYSVLAFNEGTASVFGVAKPICRLYRRRITAKRA